MLSGKPWAEEAGARFAQVWGAVAPAWPGWLPGLCTVNGWWELAHLRHQLGL